MSYYYYRRFDPVSCAIRPVGSAVVMGSLLTAWDVVVQGAPFQARTWGLYVGGLYVYNLIQCPMEALSGGRPSAWHNVIAGGTLGYIGVERRLLAVPFLDSYFFYRYPQISPPMAGAAVYGAMAGLLATLGGKPF